MNILHTSDLHLGDTWDTHPRLSDRMRVLGEILGLCEQHDVDILLITGDIFADRVKGSLPDVARQFLEMLRDQLARGMAVFLLRGNHDDFRFFQLLRILVNEMAGKDRWPLVIADLPKIYSVPSYPIQILALPYLSPGWLERHPPEAEVSPEERLVGLTGVLANHVHWLGQQVDPKMPAIFAAHVLVSGASYSSEKEVEPGYARELVLAPKYLPHFTSYNALGHIHLAQRVEHTTKPTWYAGGPDRLNLGEQDYQPRVLLVNTPDRPGGEASVEEIPLTTCTPFIRQTLSGLGDLEEFCNRIPAPDPLGILTLADIPVDHRTRAEALIRQAAPRLRIEWALQVGPTNVDQSPGDHLDFYDIPATVGTYLDNAYGKHPEKLVRLRWAFDKLFETAPGEEKL
jgi:exonuclease SbcD